MDSRTGRSISKGRLLNLNYACMAQAGFPIQLDAVKQVACKRLINGFSLYKRLKILLFYSCLTVQRKKSGQRKKVEYYTIKV